MTRMLAALGASMLIAVQAGAVTVPTRADLETMRVGSLFSGVGSITTVTPGAPVGGGGYCSASLVSRNVILTAAHCVESDPNQRFVLKDGNGFTGYAFSSVANVPNYSTGNRTDMALVRLDRRVSGNHEIYEIFSGNDIGAQFTMVGSGLAGTTTTGIDLSVSDNMFRYGFNRYDLTGSAFTDAFNAFFGRGPENLPTQDILFYDIDNGLALNDVFGRFIGLPDTGIFIDGVLKESGIAPGDSGGPDFIDGKISGIHTFGFSGSTFQDNICGEANSVDVAATAGFGCGNASIGDIGASVRTSIYRDYINTYISLSAVPEPASWAMMIAGIAAAGGMMRRQRRVAEMTTAIA